MACIHRASLAINCGYARVSVYDTSQPEQHTGRNSRETVNREKRIAAFKKHFNTHDCPEKYFEVNGAKDGRSQFERDCSRIMDGFTSKFLSGARGDKTGYLDTFSLGMWYQLSVEERKNMERQIRQKSAVLLDL